MNYLEGPLFIHIDVTQRCNLRCIHCRNNSDLVKDEISLEQLKSFINECKKDFPNFKQVFIGGGEPLMRKEEIFELARYCNNLGLKCSLNTNVTLVKEEDIENLKLFSAIQVSLDGAVAETHDKIRGVGGSFDKAINNIKLLLKNNIYVCVRMTLFELNYDEV